MNRIMMYSLMVLTLSGGVWADRLMDPAETETLLRQLTDTPRQFWISEGMIRARHLEYYDYDNTVKEATETVYRRGVQFRMEVRLEDGLSIEGSADKDSSRQFAQDFKLNRDRVFVWDGRKYVQYYESADYAVVVTDLQEIPMETSGPMTAGLIPWGHGDFTFLAITSQNPQSWELSVNGQTHLLLAYMNPSISPAVQVSFVLDPSKANAVLSYTMENEQALLRQTYENYVQIADQWVPAKVLVERFDKRSGSPQLISYEDWKFETVDPTVPSEELFSVHFKNGTTVELKPVGKIKSFIYNASDQVDISKILEDKITLIETQDPQTVNCATAAVQRIAKQFSKELLPPQLAGLISAQTKKTSLSDMKQVLEEAGLNCMAIKTDLETLEKIPNCTKIIHLAISNHYVILDHVDQDGIWVIDLTNRKFYTNRPMDEFQEEWNHGAVLLVSNAPIAPPLNADFRYLEADEMSRVQGGDFGKYSCTDRLQVTEHILCPEPMGGFFCGGAYYAFSERWGCKEDENGGNCTGQEMLSYQFNSCINHPYWQGACSLTSTWTSRYIRACQ